MALRPNNSVSPSLIKNSSNSSFHNISVNFNQIRSFCTPIKRNQQTENEQIDNNRPSQTHQYYQQIEKQNKHLQQQLISKLEIISGKEAVCEKLQYQLASLEGWNNELSQELIKKQQQQVNWKKKYDGYLNSVVVIKANYEVEIKELQFQMKQLSRKLSLSRPDQDQLTKIKFLEGEVQQLQELISMKSRENTVMSNNLKIMSEEIKKHQFKLENYKQKAPLITSDSIEDLPQMKQIITYKNKEIEQLLREKSSLIEQLQDLNKKDDQSDLIGRYDQLVTQNNQLIFQLDQNYLDLQQYKLEREQILIVNEDLHNKISQKEIEFSKLQRLLSEKDKQIEMIEKELFQRYDMFTTLSLELKQSQNQLEESKKCQTQLEESIKCQTQIEESKKCQSQPTSDINIRGEYELNQLKIQLNEKIRKSDQQQEFIKKLQDLLEIKTKECDENFRLRQGTERQLNLLSEDMEALKSRFNHIEREKIVEQEELQVKLVVNHQHMTQKIKSDYEQKMQRMQDEMVDLRRSTSSMAFSSKK